MKYLFFIHLLSYVLLAHAAQPTVSEVCAGLKNLSSCRFKFSVPTGYTVKTKEVSEKVLNKCKTKKKEIKPCPTKKQPSKTCDTMTCVSGYDITNKRVPTGLKISTREVNLCETVSKVLGQSEGDTFIKSSDAICKCFPRLDQLSTTAQFKSLSQGTISPSNGKVADELLGIQTCLKSGGFDTEMNFSEVKGSLQSGNGFTNVQAFDMDESTNANLIAGIKSCQKGACNSTLITDTIQNVFRMSDDVDKELKGYLTTWKNMMLPIKSASADLTDWSAKLMSYVASAQAQIDSINARCAESGSCTGPAVSSFMQQVDRNIAAINYLGTLEFPSDIASTFDGLIERIQGAWEQKWSRDDIPAVPLFKDNKVKTTNDLFQLMPMITDLDDVSNDIKTRLDPFTELLPKEDYTNFAVSTVKEEQKLASMKFDEIEQELGIEQNEGNRELIEKLYAMRDLIKKNNDDYSLYRFIGAVSSIQGQLNYLSPTMRKFTVSTEVVSYKAWSKLPGMAMPCSRQKNKTYKDSGFKEVFSYSDYFKCMVDGMIAAFPDRQMGYVRITS